MIIIETVESLQIKDKPDGICVYQEDAKEIVNTPFIVYEDLEWKAEMCEHSLYPTGMALWRRVQERMEENDYQKCLSEYEMCCVELKKFKKKDVSQMEVKKKLRQQKQELQEKLENQREQYEREALVERYQGQHLFSLSYKHGIKAYSIGNLAIHIPELKTIQSSDMLEKPWFVSDAPDMVKRWQEGHSFAMEGGNCILGRDEFYLRLIYQNGSERLVDFISCVEYETDSEEKRLFTKSGLQDIVRIESIRKKNALTIEEYALMESMFELSKALNIPMILTLPDMAYRKTFESMCSEASELVQREAIQDFKEKLYEVSDMNLQWIHRLEKRYPEVKLQILHDRNEELCAFYYEERKKYLTENRRNSLTRYENKKEAIEDYVTMPAVPSYVYGVQDIIEINHLQEVESIYKCKKMHKNLHIYGMYTSLMLTEDNQEVMYFSKAEHKTYIPDDFGERVDDKG